MVRLARQHGMGVSEAQQIFQAADRGDVVAAQVVTITAQYLGRGLAILVDILNPERIIIGSIFARQHKQLWPIAESVLRTESLDRSMAVCRVLPAALGEQIGDFAALAVACEMLDKPSIATA
jgi:glucokinase